MRTFVTLFVSSEGTKTSVVVDKLGTLGFRPILGTHDFVYNWPMKAPNAYAVVNLIDKVQEILKGDNVMLHFVTEE